MSRQFSLRRHQRAHRATGRAIARIGQMASGHVRVPRDRAGAGGVPASSERRILGQRSDRGTWAAATRSDILEADPQQRLAGGAEVDLVEVPLE